jgi:hypothetical protein
MRVQVSSFQKLGVFSPIVKRPPKFHCQGILRPGRLAAPPLIPAIWAEVRSPNFAAKTVTNTRICL